MLSRFSCVQLFATVWTVACQAPQSSGILQARILEWVAVPSSRGFSLTQGLNPRLHCRHSLTTQPPGKTTIRIYISSSYYWEPLVMPQPRMKSLTLNSRTTSFPHFPQVRGMSYPSSSTTHTIGLFGWQWIQILLLLTLVISHYVYCPYTTTKFSIPLG